VRTAEDLKRFDAKGSTGGANPVEAARAARDKAYAGAHLPNGGAPPAK
jgi:hypothetical protein